MKKLAACVLVLCTCTTACRKDTGNKDVWRAVEPRLRGLKWRACNARPLAPGRVVAEVACGATAPAEETCDEDIVEYDEALRVLSLQPRCTYNVIDALERFARTDRTIMSDVAAAYYVAAQREDRASHLLRAYDAAERAVEAEPEVAEARFNLALVQEAIGLNQEARGSWNEFLKLDRRSDWAAEARRHLARLETVKDPGAQWRQHQAQLPDALKARNAADVARLIEPFPKNALQYFEDELLPRGNLESIELYANALSTRLGGGRYVLDAANAAAANREGHAALRGARNPEAYAQASRLLKAGGSPVYLEAERRRAIALAIERRFAEAAALLDPIEKEAEARDYSYLLAVIRSARGYVLSRQSHYLESIAAYDSAKATFERLRDAHHLANVYRNVTGSYWDVGEYELAWREALQALRHLQYIPDVRIRHGVIGEAARAALALGYGDAALQLQDSAIRMIRQNLVAVAPEQLAQIDDARANLSSALRGRASIRLHLEDYDGAREDIREAKRLHQKNTDDPNSRAVEALIAEVEGRALLPTNPAGAAAAFTRAFERIAADELRTFRASLLAQRAEAHRVLGNTTAAENDLQAALRELHLEERQILEQRTRGEGEDIWISYFARFHDTYERLIRHLVAQNRLHDAFAYAERARAFEPLDLVLRSTIAPAAFRAHVQDGPMSLQEVQQELPHGTFLLQYSVTDDRTYTWILSRDGFRFLSQNVRRADVQRWAEDLQSARRDAVRFSAGLDAPYDRLVAAPLAAIAAMGGRQPPRRLVIIPDGAMHGLPFPALRNPTTRKYLVELAPIEIAGSATLYVFSLLRDRALSARNPSALLIGDPAFDPQLTLAQGLKRLKGADSEVRSIRGLYEPYVDVLVGGDATVPAFLRLARDKAVVHIGGHSIVNARQPSRSLLILAPSPQHSGAVEAQELLTRLKLDQTRLFVLAACSSAGGFPVGPQGVAPLVRPLIAAGVPAVLGTLWDVEDATAEALSVSFHRHYGQGSDAAVALQAAQLELLRNENPGLRLPLAWAPFQVIGHASSPFESTQKRANGGTHLGFHRQNSLQRDDGLHPQ